MFWLFLWSYRLVTADSLTTPEIVEHPKDAYIVKNNPASLTCTAKNAGELRFKCNDNWFDASARVKENKWMEDGVQMISGSLDIRKNTVESYLGPDYFCNCVAWARDDAAPVSSSNAKVRIAYLKNEFLVPPYVDGRHLVGQNVEINCVPPEGQPKPKISWLKNDMPIEPDKDPNIILNYEGNLIIKAARLRDSGEYRCRAENLVGSRTSNAAVVTVSVNGGWGRWTDWSKCPKNSCSKNRRERQRKCDTPPPSKFGLPCSGKTTDEEDCKNECGIDGGWSSWRQWSQCNKECLQTQERTCSKPVPANGGAACVGSNFEEQPCSGGFCQSKASFLTSLSSQPALAAGLAVVTVLFLSAIAIGIIVLRRVRSKNAKRTEQPGRCQTSRCSDLYDRYIPGYISTSASSAGDSSQNNRHQQMIEHQMVDFENNQVEQQIIASTGGEMTFSGVTLVIPPDALGRDETVSLRVCGGDGPLLPPHQVLLSPVVIVGPSNIVFKRPVNLHIPHCIHSSTPTHNLQTDRRNHERLLPNEYYGWEVEVKPPGPQLKLHKMKRNHQNIFSIMYQKPGAWALVGAPKISNIQNFPSSSKSVYILIYGKEVDLTTQEVQIRVRVCDQLPSTLEMIEREERSNRSKRLYDPVTIGVTRSTSGLRIRLEPASHDWRCTMVTTSQEVPVSQLWRRSASPVCFNLRRLNNSPSSQFLNLNLNVFQGQNSQPHYIKAVYHVNAS